MQAESTWTGLGIASSASPEILVGDPCALFRLAEELFALFVNFDVLVVGVTVVTGPEDVTFRRLTLTHTL